MVTAYKSLTDTFQRLAQLEHASTFLEWDQLVMMPPQGSDARSNAIAEIAAMHHEILCSPQVNDQISTAQDEERDPERRRSLIEMKQAHQQAACLPAELVRAKSLAGSKCKEGWGVQRKNNDWPAFLKNFRVVVKLAQEEAQARQYAAPDRYPTPYDSMLDLYCRGDDSALIQSVFKQLKNELPGLLEQVLSNQPQDIDYLQGNYPIDSQVQLNRKLMKILGFDFNGGRLDISLHPFSTGGRGDQRITTRFRETDFLDALLATAHETGHASYENGLPSVWDGLPIGKARNMCIHESQSLLFEKQIFLSRPFFHYFSAAIHESLPDSCSFPQEVMWHANIAVKRSLIRVEADEVTYPLHVILRFEIENALINGTLDAADIPDVWDEKMQSYLGISTKGNYADGCMQDIHWTDGSFGYFPAYTLGALNAAQFFSAICKDHRDWQEQLGLGDISFIRQWLDERVWKKASSIDCQEILTQATGEKTNSRFFLDHIKNRYLHNHY